MATTHTPNQWCQLPDVQEISTCICVSWKDICGATRGQGNYFGVEWFCYLKKGMSQAGSDCFWPNRDEKSSFLKERNENCENRKKRKKPTKKQSRAGEGRHISRQTEIEDRMKLTWSCQSSFLSRLVPWNWRVLSEHCIYRRTGSDWRSNSQKWH